jgi:hypothetical protein
MKPWQMQAAYEDHCRTTLGFRGWQLDLLQPLHVMHTGNFADTVDDIFQMF